MNMRVLLADDHALIRAGLRALLLTMPGVGEVHEAGDGVEALTELAQHDPDIVLMDIAMPGMNGLQAMARIREVCPRTRVIILSMHAGEEYVSRALRAGASGYVVKAGAAEDLQQALGLAMRGQTYVSPSARPRTSPRARDGAGSAEQLTDRHLEVLKLISQGHRTRQIATTLGIAVKTVEADAIESVAHPHNLDGRTAHHIELDCPGCPRGLHTLTHLEQEDSVGPGPDTLRGALPPP